MTWKFAANLERGDRVILDGGHYTVDDLLRGERTVAVLTSMGNQITLMPETPIEIDHPVQP